MHALSHSMPPTLQLATVNPRRLLDIHGQVSVCLVGSLLLSPGSWYAQVFVCALQESVSPVLCKFWWLYGRVNGNLLKEGLCHIQACCTQNHWPCGRPLLTCISAGDTQTLKSRSGSVSVGSPSVHKVWFEPSEHLWQLWGLILNVILPSYCFAGDSPLLLDVGYLFFGGIQHFPVEGCSAVSCNFGVLAGEDEGTSFYSSIL